MSLICVDKENCRRDGLCIEACPPRILKAGEDGYPVVEEGAEAACVECGHCVAVCSSGAMSHERLPMEEFLPAQQVKPETAGELEALMRSRRSVREYKDKPVDRAILAGLMDTVHYAPTAVNSRKVGWIVVEDRSLTRRLAELGAEWMASTSLLARYSTLWDQGSDTVLRGAPHVVLAHTPADYAWGETDSVIALSYLELAAAARGLGTCWAGLLTRAVGGHPALAKAIGLPEGQKVHGALMLGWPKYRYRLVPPRKSAGVTWL
jgi:nitroreductase/NAD-dependent dihydropyrimidine dehydrogenase PreA subunit